MVGGKETVSPYSEWVGWSGVVVVVEGGRLAYLTKAARKLGLGGGGGSIVRFCYYSFHDSSKLFES